MSNNTIPDEYKGIIRKCIKSSEKYLAENNLDYIYLDVNTRANSIDAAGYLTLFLESCGINTIEAFKDTLPGGYCCGIVPPPSVMSGNILTLPSNIRYIGQGAFMESKGFQVADLRGVISIGRYAFTNSSVEQVRFDDSAQYIDDMAFANCNLKVIYLPDDDLFEVMEHKLKKLFIVNEPRIERL